MLAYADVAVAEVKSTSTNEHPNTGTTTDATDSRAELLISVFAPRVETATIPCVPLRLTELFVIIVVA